LELPYEPDRLLDHFINQAAPIGPGVEWVAHTGNTNPASEVGELAVKPDLDMQLTTHTASWVKIAATATISMEIAQDFAVFMKFVPSELFRAIVDAETDYFVNNGSNGLLNVSGVLTRSVGSDTNIDALAKAANDIRVGSAFGLADLVAMHPTSWDAVRLSKATTGSYLLCPGDPANITGVNRVFGMDVVTNTHIPAGTAIVMDRKKAVIRWVRMGYTLETNSYGVAADGTNLWTQNAIGFRGELREQIGVQYPTAINLLTGLPTS
jgi:HK97 family phage major capsid protein